MLDILWEIGNQEVVQCNGKEMVERVLDYLHELKEEAFVRRDLMTVGEANGVRLEQADEWVGEENGKFNMIFQFEHLGLWDKGADSGVDVLALKHTLTKWQKGLLNRGWRYFWKIMISREAYRHGGTIRNSGKKARKC